ncbi:MAG: cupin domain-containing protein [Granulosicoccus sp.]|nr:cupin domain-containing protein [Granulosicoccus sp.]
MQINWPDGLNAAVFLQDYWQQKPLLIRQALPDFENPLTPDELGGLALDDDIHSRLILRQRATTEQSHDTWHLRNGPFSEEELTELPPRDWSLLVSDIEKHLDGFHQYLEPYRFIPDWRIDDLMISYAPTGASVGAHIDAYDVFLFQASGQRQWSISTDPLASTALIPDIDLKILSQFTATEEWELNPGDLLYLPPGVPHHGVSMDDNCMTWSVGFRAPMHSALINDINEQLLQKNNQRYQDRALQPIHNKGEIDAQSLDNIKQLWDTATLVETDEFNIAVGRALTQRGEPAAEALPLIAVEEFQQRLQQQSVSRSPSSRLAYIPSLTNESNSHAEFFVDGEHHTISLNLAQQLCASYEWEPGVLQIACVTDSDRACLLTLWQLGVLHTTE